MRISDWSSDVCSSDLDICDQKPGPVARLQARRQGQLPLRAGGQERTHQRDQTGKRAMIARIIEGSIANRLFIVLASFVNRSEERSVGQEWDSTYRFRSAAIQ